MIHLSSDRDKLEITTDVIAQNGDTIGKNTLSATRHESGEVTVTTSAFLPVRLAPHEAAYLTGWLAASEGEPSSDPVEQAVDASLEEIADAAEEMRPGDES